MALYNDRKEEYELERFYESIEQAKAERLYQEKLERQEKEKEVTEGVLDELGLTGGCRKCPWILEPLEGFWDDDWNISGEQLLYLRLTCIGCKGKGTGHADPEHEKRLMEDWNELTEWVKGMGIQNPARRCLWCRNVYAVYGKFKDPDDEWNAFEDLCKDCKIFQEV